MSGSGDARVSRLGEAVRQLFPEREIFIRHGAGFRALKLSSGRQAIVACTAAALMGWALVSTAGIMGFKTAAVVPVGKSAAYYERLLADRQARLVAATTHGAGSLEGLAREVEARHAALALLLHTDVRALPAMMRGGVAARIAAVRNDQERLAETAQSLGHDRADRMRTALKVAGLDAPADAGPDSARDLGRGGPLIEARDPAALARVLGVDPAFAARIRDAAAEMGDADKLHQKVERLPLAEPLSQPHLSSGFGFRHDPFNGHAAFHAGQDFSGGMYTPVKVTGPGVVSFTGVRSGYGNVVEVQHAGGFMTRYAHLARIDVRPGARVAAGQEVAAMGSTGRSTGPHLHYEVWMNGRVQDPVRFLKAGRYVQQDS